MANNGGSLPFLALFLGTLGMRVFILGICLGMVFSVSVGCEGSSQKGKPVATTEDEFEAYDRMIAEDQAQTAQDEADSAQ